jgi:hypothetical protein
MGVMTDINHSAALVASLAFALAVVFGAVANRVNFGTMGAVTDVVHVGDWRRMRMWLLGRGSRSPASWRSMPQGWSISTRRSHGIARCLMRRRPSVRVRHDARPRDAGARRLSASAPEI